MSAVTAPGRRIVGGSLVRSSTVDSTPIVVGPPSTTRSMRPLKVVDDVRCLRRAGARKEIGARRGDGHSGGIDERTSDRMNGTRTATVERPAVTSSGT